MNTNEVKSQAEKLATEKYANHAYVIQNKDGELRPFTHFEDRYLTSYLPNGFKVIAHGLKTYSDDGTTFYEWKDEGQNLSVEKEVLAQAGFDQGMINRLLGLLD